MSLSYALGVLGPGLALLLLIALVATIAPDPSRAHLFEPAPVPRRSRRKRRRRDG